MAEFIFNCLAGLFLGNAVVRVHYHGKSLEAQLDINRALSERMTNQGDHLQLHDEMIAEMIRRDQARRDV